jgi:hypothetical protein
MELSEQPAAITSVTALPLLPSSTDNVTVTVNVSDALAAEEKVYLRYTIDGWANSVMLPVSFTGTTGTAIIPAQADAVSVGYYVFSTVISNPTVDFDLYTINFDNNGGANYSYTVGATLSCPETVIATNPVFPLQDGSVVITFNAALGNEALAGYTGDVYAHTGVITNLSTSSSDWKYTKTTWGVNTPETLLSNIGTDLYQLSIADIRAYYGVPVGETILKLAMIFRSESPVPITGTTYLEAKNADDSDFLIDVYDNGLNVRILNPTIQEPLVLPNTMMPVCVSALASTQITLFIDNLQVDQVTTSDMTFGVNTNDYSFGLHMIEAVASDGSTYARDTTYFYIRGAVTVADLPVGVENGINYIDNNTVTLVLNDPPALKSYAFVVGDFNNWLPSDAGYMNRTPNGKHYWAKITGLTAGKEYAFQYYIDGVLKIADAYADKILDPWNRSNGIQLACSEFYTRGGRCNTREISYL